MKIAEKSGILEKISKLVSPIIRFLFPKLSKDSKAKGHIAMNMTANILGLGNVATPMGIKAMEELQKDNKSKKTITNEMIMLIVLNTTSIQLLPTTLLALRTSYNSANPTLIVMPIIIASFVSVIFGITLVKICEKLIKE